MSWLQTNTVRIARLHFVYVLAFAASIIAYDAWKLITNQTLIERWTVAIVMLVIVTIVWLIARSTLLTKGLYQGILGMLIVADILLASYLVYAGRGMASRSVVLFAIPIIVSCIFLSRSIIYATTTVSVAAYTYAAIKYFADHPSEGYKVELYGDLFFYSAALFVLASCLWVFVRSVSPKSS